MDDTGFAAFLRETPIGQAIRFATKSSVLQYPEEKSGFKIPDRCAQCMPLEANTIAGTKETAKSSSSDTDIEKTAPPLDSEQDTSNSNPAGSDTSNYITVDWYCPHHDLANPHNWSWRRKAYVLFAINLYTFTVYMASSIYTPAAPELRRIYGISAVTAALGLGLYIIGYGLGPLLFGPPSEIAAVGRNPVYVVTLSLFILLSVPTALTDNIAGFMVLRFLTGFFGSPALANGGGSIGDITAPLMLPYALYLWAFFPLAGPALGPMIAGYSVAAENWDWAMWEILWLSGLVLVSIVRVPAVYLFAFGPFVTLHILTGCLIYQLLLPETSSPNILYRRAVRLRNLTKNTKYRSRSEIAQRDLSVATIASNSLLIPWKVNILDPSVLFTSLYCALVYAIFNSFFEVFPLVYIDMYGMNYGTMGLMFLSVLVAVVVMGVPYLLFIHFVVNRAARMGTPLLPETRLIPAVCASFVMPVGMFLFAWTAKPEIHWIVPTVGVMLISGSVCLTIQSVYVYLSLAYPQYAASLLGANTLCRAALAIAAVLWSTPLYETLGVARGTSLLGGLCGGCIIGMLVLYRWGPELRRRSRFAAAE
jgi:DHA1 family multidrug resistance protein-like MFS transporter